MVLPAPHDEEATVADVVRRAPREVHGHPVEVVVVDDGSTDGPPPWRAAGATVHSLGRNRGLGAAVRPGWHVGGCGGGGRGLPRCRRRVRARGAGGPGGPDHRRDRADYVIGSRSPNRPATCARTAGSATGSSRWDEAAGAPLGRTGPQRRAVRLPGPVTGRRGPRRDHPRLQLRPGAHAGPGGQGLPLPARSRSATASGDTAILRPAGPLPAQGRAGVWRELRTTTEPEVPAADAAMPVPALVGDAPRSTPLRILGPGVRTLMTVWTLSTTTASGSRAMSAGSRSCSRTWDRSTPT